MGWICLNSDIFLSKLNNSCEADRCDLGWVWVVLILNSDIFLSKLNNSCESDYCDLDRLTMIWVGFGWL